MADHKRVKLVLEIDTDADVAHWLKAERVHAYTSDDEHATKLARVVSVDEVRRDDGRTHWDGCWKDRAHHGCAVALAERLEADLQARREHTVAVCVSGASCGICYVPIAQVTDSLDSGTTLTCVEDCKIVVDVSTPEVRTEFYKEHVALMKRREAERDKPTDATTKGT